AAQVGDAPDRLSVERDDDVAGLKLARCGEGGGHRLDQDSALPALTLVPQLPEGHGRGELLALSHVPEVLPPADPVVLAGGVELVGRDERRAFVDAGKRLLEQARLANVDGDVVDPAAVPIRLLTLDLHERLPPLRLLRPGGG